MNPVWEKNTHTEIVEIYLLNVDPLDSLVVVVQEICCRCHSCSEIELASNKRKSASRETHVCRASNTEVEMK